MVLFFVLAYAFAWAVTIPMVIFHAPIQLSVLSTCGPTFAALVVHHRETGNWRAFPLFGSLPRTAFAAACGIALILLAYVVLPAVVTANPARLHWQIFLSTSVYNYSTLIGGPIGEEPGWRGYALPRLEGRFPPAVASLILGVLWAAWHLPLFFYPGWTSSPFWIYVLMVTGLSFIMTFGANLARFASIACILMHAGFNTVSRFLNGIFSGVDPSSPLQFELVMALCGLSMAALLLLATKGRLAYAVGGVQ